MTISINEIESGIGIRINDDIYLVTEYSHVKPGKGSAFVRVKLKNIKTDLVIERTFKTADRLEDVHLDEHKLQFLYRSGDTLHFMDQESFEDLAVSESLLGAGIKFLQENMIVEALLYNNKVIKVYLPNFMVVQIVETEPGIKGDSSRSGNKPATVDTGAVIQVPLFVGKGEWVKIDLRSNGQYVERVQK